MGRRHNQAGGQQQMQRRMQMQMQVEKDGHLLRLTRVRAVVGEPERERDDSKDGLNTDGNRERVECGV